MSVYDVRPRSIGSWTFEVRERDRKGDLVASVAIARAKKNATITVRDVPFELESRRGGRETTLRFQGVDVARSRESRGWGRRMDLDVEDALLRAGVARGQSVAFALEPRVALSGSFVLRDADGEVRSRIARRGVFTRTYRLTGEDDLPLGVHLYALTLVLILVLRQQQNS